MDTDVIAGSVPLPDDPKVAGLFSPLESNLAMNFDDSDSELSEIGEDGTRIPKPPVIPDTKIAVEPKGPEKVTEQKEPDVDDIGEVVPDHYADEGRVPVFKPTMAQFKDFQIFVSFYATSFWSSL